MTDTPERIWASCETPNAKMKSGRWHESPYGTEYISRAAHDAAVSAARKEGMLEIARDLRNRAAEPGRTGPSIRALVAAAMAAEKKASETTP